MRVLAEAKQTLYVKRPSQTRLELRLVAVIFINISSVPAGRFLFTSTGFTICREGRRLSREFVISGWK